MSDALTRQLARLLQLPKNCVRATLTLHEDSLPMLRTECHVLELGDVVVSFFELRPLEPGAVADEVDKWPADATPAFDLDRMVTEAYARMAIFIDRLAQKHSNCIRIGAMLRAQQPSGQA